MSFLDEYEDKTSEEELALLKKMADQVKNWLPEVKEGRSYGMPALFYGDKPLIGFGVQESGLTIYPFSPNILNTIKDQLSGFEMSPGALRFSVDNKLSDDQFKLVVDTRLSQIEN